MRKSDAAAGKRSFARLLLLLAVLLVFSACEAKPGENAEAVGETESGADAGIPADFVCTVVRGDESSQAVTEAAVALRRILTDAGLLVDIRTDWVKRGEEIRPFPNEILIGPTNRPESEALYGRFREAAEPSPSESRTASRRRTNRFSRPPRRSRRNTSGSSPGHPRRPAWNWKRNTYSPRRE